MRLMIDSMFWEKNEIQFHNFSFTKKTRAENFGVFVVQMDKISGAVSPGWRYAFFVCGFPGVMVATNSFRRRNFEKNDLTKSDHFFSACVAALLLQGFHCATPQRWKLKSSTNICSTKEWASNHPKSSTLPSTLQDPPMGISDSEDFFLWRDTCGDMNKVDFLHLFSKFFPLTSDFSLLKTETCTHWSA